MKKLVSLILALTMLLAMTACSDSESPKESAEASESSAAESGNEIKKPESDVEMKKMTAEEALSHVNEEGYTFFDVRKSADYAEGHIPGAVGVDMDAAKEGDFEAGVQAMQEATKDLDDNLILICYTGNRYAQATTNVLSALGYDMDKVYTLEGGFKEWSSVYPDNIEK